MSDTDNNLNFGKPIDDDYIGVEKRRAEVSVDGEIAESDDLARDSATAQRADMSRYFDDSGGHGAASETDELIDETAIIENDGRSDTRTFYYPEEAAEGRQRQYARMIRWQDGEGSSERDVRNRAADRSRTIDTFCGHLSMGEAQRARIAHVAEGLNMSHMAHYSSQKVILAIVSLVANEDGRFIRNERTFRRLADDIGTSQSEVKNIRGLVRDKSSRL